MPTHNSKTSENQRKSGMSNQNRGFRVHKTRPNRSQNHSRTTRENQLAESPELTTRWNEAVAKAEIIARLVPNDDADETTILCYMRNWRTATTAMTEVIDDTKRCGLTCPTVSAELSKLFKGAKEFFTCHSPKYTHLLDLEKTKQSATTHSAHARKVFPTSDDDAVHSPTSSSRTLPKGKGRDRRKEQVESEIDPTPHVSPIRYHYTTVAIQLESGEMELLAYDGSNDQKARIAYPMQACIACRTAGIICTGPTVGWCARCKVTRHGCSNSTATLEEQGSTTPEPNPERKQTKRKRDDVAIPAPETPEPSIHTEVAAPHQSVQQSSLFPPCIRRHHADTEHSMNREARSPSLSMPGQSTVANLQEQSNALTSRQTRVLQKTIDSQVELQTMALAIQTMIGKIAPKVKDAAEVK